MEIIQDNVKTFIKDFSGLKIGIDNLPPRIKLPRRSKFLTDEIGTRYIGNMVKDIDIRLYLTYIEMVKDINFIDDYNVEESLCYTETKNSVAKKVEIRVPRINNSVDLLTTSHEVGHGLKSFTMINKERFLMHDTIYDETISILFGRICLERYINDFGFDIFSQQFDLSNISNAISCLNRLNKILPEYIKKESALVRETGKIVENNQYGDYKYQSFVNEVDELKEKIFRLISYPIGISLANVYDNFTVEEKKEYLSFISKFLLNIKHIDLEMILESFNISLNSDFYIKNFEEYVQKFNDVNNKFLVLGGRK